ncbi:MAG: methylated-DNA--[protein]-cysteine S-methyltransferase [Lachnospiraceae bacterium]|nr:methylated-DNA--[protein]-cysteine S-methyltransferase [Lachnospiraceae bacterium]
MRTAEEALAYALTFPETYRDAPFHDDNWQLVRFSPNRKTFLLVYEKDGRIQLNVKADPEKAFFWRRIYASVLPGYHQNKDHWNTIILDGCVPDDEVKRMIAESYDLVSNSPSRRIYEAVRRIPYGKVATYAQIAELAGDRKMARAVGNALHRNPDPESIPCFRVVNAQGKLSGSFAFGGEDVQQRLLENEGIEVKDHTVDLSRYQWNPASGEE